MVCRRRWQELAMVLLLGALPAFALGAPVDDANAMKNAADGAAKADIRARVVAAAVAMPTATDKDNYGKLIAGKGAGGGAFLPLLVDANAETRLNAAILIAQLGTISTDGALIDMLSNPDPAVRYWGAKGLGGIAPTLIRVGPAAAIRALVAAMAKEKSGIVAQEIIKTLAKYNDSAALLNALDNLSNLLADAVPDVGMLNAASDGLNAIVAATASASPADKLLAAKDASRLASFAAQQYIAAEAAAKELDGLPKEYVDAVHNVLDSATKVANAAAAGSFRTPTGSSSGELMLNAGSLFGSPGGSPGDLQKKLAGVPIPPQVKAPQ